MSGLTATGFERATVEELIAAFESAQRSQVDPALNTSATSVVGNLNAIYALKLGQLWELAQAVYDSHDPAGASGVALDGIGALRGVKRLLATRSSADLTLTLDPGAVVAAGSVVSQQGVPTVRFVTQVDAENSGGGPASFDVVALAEDAGPIVAGASTLSVIESPSSGWTAVTNLAAATQGKAIETDAEYRLRQVTELSRAGSSTPAGIASDVRAVAGVTSVTVLENVSDVTDGGGMPPHSFEVVVLGGDDTAIAQAIWQSKPAGIATTGSTAVLIVDADGRSHVVHFTRPTTVAIGLRWHGTFDSTYDTTPSNPGVLQAIAKAVGDPQFPGYFAVGADVYLARIIEAAMTAQGVVNLTINVAAGAIPSSSIPSAVNYSIPISARQLPQLGPFTADP